MKLDLIILGIVAVVFALIFLRWKLARVVLIESLTHPRRTTVIKIKSAAAGNDAEKSTNNTRKAQRVVVNN